MTNDTDFRKMARDITNGYWREEELHRSKFNADKTYQYELKSMNTRISEALEKAYKQGWNEAVEKCAIKCHVVSIEHNSKCAWDLVDEIRRLRKDDTQQIGR